MSNPKTKIEPWPIAGGYRIALTWWEYEFSGGVEGWVQEHRFMTPETYSTSEACQAAIDAGAARATAPKARAA